LFSELGGILLGRPGGPLKPEDLGQYGEALVGTVREEYGLTHIPIISDMDFGHTDPMFVIPLGVTVRIYSGRRQVSIPESAVD
jgi:muramoyltetrapeptide carboxypeptidase LdcA involved in peptidoglycan recycling